LTTQVTSIANGNTSIDPFTSVGTGQYIIPAGIFTSSEGITFRNSFRSGTMTIAGGVFGYDAGIKTEVGNNGAIIGILSTGTVSADANSGVAISLVSRHVVDNAGTIMAVGTSAVGIATYGNGSILNSGTISVSSSNGGIAILNADSLVTDVCSLINRGDILGSLNAYSGADSIDQITNSGTMMGDVATSGGNDTVFNFGHIYGNIDMGSENDTLYTDMSALGPYTIQGGAGSDLLVNIDNNHTAAFNMADIGFETYYGGSQASYAFGGTATVGLTFVGGVASDAFIGGTGADVAAGGAGGDYLDGGAGSNTLSYGNSTAAVNINLAAGTASGGDAANDAFLNFQNVNGSVGNDVLVGDAGANSLYGDAGNDYLYGGGGGDVLIGATGNDTLYGAAGNDIFYFGPASGFGNDEIVDFTGGQDRIYIGSALVAYFAALSMAQTGANVTITIGADHIQVDNVTLASLTSSNFVFF
jgi:Ca2+-binding RTX toxin-like protein